MGWQSSLLGGNVVSTYQQLDNLRNDLVAGKFWDKTDGTETHYTQIKHDSTNGILDTDSGDLILKREGSARITIGALATTHAADFAVSAGNSLIAYRNDGTSSVRLYCSSSSSKSILYSTAFALQIGGGNGGNLCYIGQGTGQSKIYMYDATLAAWKYFAIDNGAAVIG